MRLVSLNTWGATQGKVFFDYIKKQAGQTDIFCFQEIFSALPPAPKISSGARMYLFEELSATLSAHAGFFEPRSSNFNFEKKVQFPVFHGLAVFVKKNIKIFRYSGRTLVDVVMPDEPVEGLLKVQELTLEKSGKKLSVLNFHGAARPGSKLDTKARIDAMTKLKSVWNNLPSQNKILCGDFNLYPETKSIKIMDSCAGNLIKRFKIANTRNRVSWQNNQGNKQYFADYTFVSPGIKVKKFDVPYNEVSDHLPMILEFEV